MADEVEFSEFFASQYAGSPLGRGRRPDGRPFVWQTRLSQGEVARYAVAEAERDVYLDGLTNSSRPISASLRADARSRKILNPMPNSRLKMT